MVDVKTADAKTTDATATVTLNVLLRQAQTVITCIYLLMVGCGMLYYHQKYSAFNINIFQYADILDFLIAPFEDSFIFVLSAAAAILFLVGYYLDVYIEQRFPRFYSVMYFGSNKKSWFKSMQMFSWPLSFLLLLVLYSGLYGDRSKEKVLASDPIQVVFSDDQKMTGKMIGKTSDTLFLLHGEKVKAIPLSSLVKEVVIDSSFVE